MNSDKSNGANEKSRAIDIARENDELSGGASMKDLETRVTRRGMKRVSGERKADHAADFMDSIIRICCLCSSSLSMSSRHRTLHGKGQRREEREGGKGLRVA